MKTRTVIILVVLAAVGAGLFLVLKANPSAVQNSVDSKSGVSKNISKIELEQNNGQSGKPCWVAVESKVYLIPEDSPLWQDGKHSESKGLAYCGADMTEIIKQSPHGKTKLVTLEEVGNLVE